MNTRNRFAAEAVLPAMAWADAGAGRAPNEVKTRVQFRERGERGEGSLGPWRTRRAKPGVLFAPWNLPVRR